MGHYDQRFVAAVKAFRLSQGMTQGALGALIGLRQNQVSRLESGLPQMMMSLDVFARLCRVMGTTPNEVLDFKETDHGQGD